MHGAGAAVTIKCPDNSGEKELTKKLPKTMTVQKLKGLLQRLYKVDSSEQKLSYLDNRVSRPGPTHVHYAMPRKHARYPYALYFPLTPNHDDIQVVYTKLWVCCVVYGNCTLTEITQN